MTKSVFSPLLPFVRPLLLPLLLALGACAPGAQRVAPPAVPTTLSVSEADAKLEQVAAARASAEAAYADSERVCYAKFFVNNCLVKAKETRRLTLLDLRAIEVEASHFKRADAVARRDAELVRSNAAAAEDLAAREAAAPKAIKVVAPEAPPQTGGKTLAERQAQHDSKISAAAAKEQAEAGLRAARTEQFERKQLDALARQKKVADTLAEKQAKAAAKAAAQAAADAKVQAAAAAKAAADAKAATDAAAADQAKK